MRDKLINYSVGALLYCPANDKRPKNSLVNSSLGDKYSLAFCLEDTINDKSVDEAIDILFESLNFIYDAQETKEFYLPKIFIRVREPEQIGYIYSRLCKLESIVTGFIAPKFSADNAMSYVEEIEKINFMSEKPMYFMPILESSSLFDLRYRVDALYKIRDILMQIEDLVLNVRVGGNDFCHAFGFRRNVCENIHDIGAISSILSDIITVFSENFVVSGPVWEYYGGEGWEAGLVAEIKRDRLSGFVGKTVIHPKQITAVNEGYKVTKTDFEDAKLILNWDENKTKMVSGNIENARMNEQKTHFNWAKKVMFLAEYYGIRD